MRSSRVWMRSSRVSKGSCRVWMSSSQVAWASDCQCQSRSSPGFNPSILRHSGSRGRQLKQCWTKYFKNSKNPLNRNLQAEERKSFFHTLFNPYLYGQKSETAAERLSFYLHNISMNKRILRVCFCVLCVFIRSGIPQYTLRKLKGGEDTHRTRKGARC